MTAVAFRVPVDAADRPRVGRGGLMLGVIVVAALLARVGFLARPFESDSGLYIYMGKALVEGEMLYRNFYETKMPGVALFTAGLYKVFGDHWPAYVLLQGVMTVVAAWVLSRAAARLAGAGMVRPIFAFTLVFLNFSSVAYRGFQLETVQCFFACIAGAFGLRALCPAVGVGNDRVVLAGEGNGRVSGWTKGLDCFGVGLFGGIAAMFKPTAAAVAGALILTLALRGPGRGRSILAIVAGLLFAPALVFLWVWRAGLLGEMPGLLREISLYGSGTPIVAADWIKPGVALIVGAFPFLIVHICRSGAETQAKHPHHNQMRSLAAEEAGGRETGRPVLIFALFWLMLEALGVLLQRRMYIYHFLPVGPPLALLFGFACAGRRPGVYGVALAPILLISLIQSRGDFGVLLKSGIPNLPESDYLLAHAAAGDQVVGDPLERVLMETHLRCGARYAHLFYFMNHDDAPLEYVGRFLEDLDRNRPRWAVFRTDSATHRLMQCRGQTMLSENPRRRENFLTAWGKIDLYLGAHYKAVAQAGEMTIYRRR